mgnify:CR=1 FL=1
MSVFFLMIRRPPRSTLDRSSAASDVYKRQHGHPADLVPVRARPRTAGDAVGGRRRGDGRVPGLSLIHISEPTRPY